MEFFSGIYSFNFYSELVFDLVPPNYKVKSLAREKIGRVQSTQKGEKSNNQVSLEIILLFDISLFSLHFHVLSFVHHQTIHAFWVSLANMTKVYN